VSSTSPNLAARNHIAARLITHHGLDPLEAHTAVTRVHLGLPTEHELLVCQEARAAMNEAAEELRQRLIEAFAPIAAAMKAFSETLARTLEQLPQPPGRSVRSRPAWQSPYGPPRKGHRR
jgi:hypothetical protein